jgi:hypothetical protein
MSLHLAPSAPEESDRLLSAIEARLDDLAAAVADLRRLVSVLVESRAR